MKTVYYRIRERSDRIDFVVDTFADFLKGKLLDVGCDEAHLKNILPDLEYTGIDIAGSPDIEINLEQEPILPFEDNSFDTVLCTDVLEHLDNLHQIFGELVRVTRKHLIVSLPNNWQCARVQLQRGKGQISHYGLPAEKPLDRHKWFFSLEEAWEFMSAQEGIHPVSIHDRLILEKPRSPIVRALRHLRHPREFSYANRYAYSLWTVFEKNA